VPVANENSTCCYTVFMCAHNSFRSASLLAVSIGDVRPAIVPLWSRRSNSRIYSCNGSSA
jgi:hypothetical protein